MRHEITPDNCRVTKDRVHQIILVCPVCNSSHWLGVGAGPRVPLCVTPNGDTVILPDPKLCKPLNEADTKARPRLRWLL